MKKLGIMLISMTIVLFMVCGCSSHSDETVDVATEQAVAQEMAEIEAAREEAREKIKESKDSDLDKKEKHSDSVVPNETVDIKQSETDLNAEKSAEMDEKNDTLGVVSELEDNNEAEEGLADNEGSGSQERTSEHKNNDGEYGFDTYNEIDRQNTAAIYVLNTSTMKIHHPDCKSVPKIKPENYAETNESLKELLDKGYTTCGQEKNWRE